MIQDRPLSEVLRDIPTTGTPAPEYATRQADEAKKDRIEKLVIWFVIALAVFVTVVKGSEVAHAANRAANRVEASR